MAWAYLRANLQTPIAANFPSLQKCRAHTHWRHNLHYIEETSRLCWGKLSGKMLTTRFLSNDWNSQASKLDFYKTSNEILKRNLGKCILF